MFESHKKYYSNNRRYPKKNSFSYHSHQSSTKPRTKKRKGSLVEIDDNFTYQTTPTTNTIKEKEQKTEEEVTEFQLEPEFESNKENIQDFANIQINDKPTSNHSSLSFSSQSSTGINVSNDTLQEAYYFPKKLTNIYNYLYNQIQMQYQMYNSPSMYQIAHMNNNLNAGPSPIYSRHPSSNAVVPSNTYANVSPFNYFDPPFSPQTTTMSPEKKYNSSNSLNLSNIHIGNSYYDKDKENTDILTINIKVSNDETLVFKIRRYDDMFKTVKIFCEINKLDVKYIRPLILYIIKALNGIYGIVNLTLKEEEIKFLCGLKETYSTQ